MLVSVVNQSDPITVGGITFASGATSIQSTTLELLSALGLFNGVMTPNLFVDLKNIVDTGSLAITFTLTADGTIG